MIIIIIIIIITIPALDKLIGDWHAKENGLIGDKNVGLCEIWNEFIEGEWIGICATTTTTTTTTITITITITTIIIILSEKCRGRQGHVSDANENNSQGLV